MEAICGPIRPIIKVDTNLQRGISQSIAALVDVPVYQRGNMLVEVVENAPKPKLCLVEDGASKLRPVPPATLAGLLTEVGRYEKWNEKKGKWVSTIPSQSIVNGVHDSPIYPGIPSIMGVSSCPILRADGTIADRAGYDPLTGMYLDLAGAYPNLMEIDQAVNLLLDLLVDFPFVSRRTGTAG